MDNQEDRKNPFQVKSMQSESNFANDTFSHIDSHGANQEKLAKICAVYKMTMKTLGWPSNLIDIITGYQASIDTKYHNDFVKIAELQHYVNTLKKSRSGSPTGFYSNNTQQQGGNNNA